MLYGDECNVRMLRTELMSNGSVSLWNCWQRVRGSMILSLEYPTFTGATDIVHTSDLFVYSRHLGTAQVSK